MAVTYSTAAKTVRMTATRNHFANGTLEIQSAAGTVLVIFGLSGTGGTISGAVWTLVFDGPATAEAAAGTGTVATQARIKTSGGVADLTGLTVATSGADINVINTSIASGQSVTIASSTITHAT